jgi:spermidine/putrescine transport system permease protein
VTEKQRPAAPVWTRILLWFVLVVLYLPLVVMLTGALYVPVDGVYHLTLHWFAEVLQDPDLMSALGNSVIVAVSNSIVSTIIGALGAIALFRSRSRAKFLLESLSTLSLIFPEIVFALSLLSWFFILTLDLGLFTVIIAHITFSLSYVLLTVSGRLATLDLSVEDAARDLGASEFQILRKVTLPLLKPALLAGFMLSLLLSFDDFLITYFVNGVGSDTLPVKLYTAMKTGVSPKLNALSSLMFLFTVLVLALFFRSPAFRVLFEAKEE